MSSALSAQFGGWLLQASLQASVVVVLVLLVKAAFHRALAPRWSYLLWMLVVVRLVLPFGPASSFSVYNLGKWIVPATASETNANTFEEARASIVGTAPVEAFHVLPEVAPASAGDHELIVAVEPAGAPGWEFEGAAPATTVSGARIDDATAASAGMPWMTLLGVVWLLGVVFFLARRGRALVSFHRRTRDLVPVRDRRQLRVLEASRRAMGVRRRVPLLESEHISSPALIGILRPRLIVPVDLADTLRRSELKLIFQHELVHLKRQDLVTNTLLSALQILHWFNPVIWLAIARCRTEQELACDDIVLSSVRPSQRTRYGLTILKVVEQMSAPRALPGSVALLQGKNEIERRIHMIAAYRSKSRLTSLLGLALLLSLGCVALSSATPTALGSACPPDETDGASLASCPSCEGGEGGDEMIVVRGTDGRDADIWVGGSNNANTFRVAGDGDGGNFVVVRDGDGSACPHCGGKSSKNKNSSSKGKNKKTKSKKDSGDTVWFSDGSGKKSKNGNVWFSDGSGKKSKNGNVWFSDGSGKKSRKGNVWFSDESDKKSRTGNVWFGDGSKKSKDGNVWFGDGSKKSKDGNVWFGDGKGEFKVIEKDGNVWFSGGGHHDEDHEVHVERRDGGNVIVEKRIIRGGNGRNVELRFEGGEQADRGMKVLHDGHGVKVLRDGDGNIRVMVADDGGHDGHDHDGHDHDGHDHDGHDHDGHDHDGHDHDGHDHGENHQVIQLGDGGERHIIRMRGGDGRTEHRFNHVIDLSEDSQGNHHVFELHGDGDVRKKIIELRGDGSDVHKKIIELRGDGGLHEEIIELHGKHGDHGVTHWFGSEDDDKNVQLHVFGHDGDGKGNFKFFNKDGKQGNFKLFNKDGKQGNFKFFNKDGKQGNFKFSNKDGEHGNLVFDYNVDIRVDEDGNIIKSHGKKGDNQNRFFFGKPGVRGFEFHGDKDVNVEHDVQLGGDVEFMIIDEDGKVKKVEKKKKAKSKENRSLRVL